jgi:hypothetical protein
MLGGGRSYEAARVRYAPFNRIVAPDPKHKGLAASRRILLYMPPGPGRPFVLAVFADSHVERRDWPSFERMLKAQLDGGASSDRTEKIRN